MKKILYSSGLIVFMSALAWGATGAFFSDSETSTGNTFTAGDIDLQIDNESYVTNSAGALVFSSSTSWGMSNLTDQLFFDFEDVKPGDVGEDTISIHVGSNDAYACMAAAITGTPENTLVDPESDAGDVGPALGNNGELQNFLNFAFWNDDGDNVYEVGESQITPLVGPASGIFNGAWSPIGTSTLPGGSTRYVAKAWCFGTLTPAPVAQGEGGPLVRGTGFTCDGSGANNIAQTDGVVVDVSFQAVQARNNAQFTCGSLPPLTGTSTEPVRAVVGALLSAYVQPEGAACDVNVASTTPALDTIQEGIDAAVAGQTVCVEAGTYVGDVNVNKDITLSGDGATLTSTIQGVGLGEAGALVISANGATVEGFNVIGTGVSAIRISGARDGVTVRYNHATAATGKNAFLTDGGQSNHTISHNLFDGAASQLVYVNGFADVAVASTNVDFTNNTFGGTATGPLLGINANGSSVTLNKFSGTTSYTSIETFEGNNLVNQNNFNVDLAGGPIHVTNSVGGQFPGTLNAEDNWWGDADPSDNITGLVDSSPSEASAFPQN